MGTQILAGQLPVLLLPAAERVLVVGAGSGVTVGSILQHTSVKSVDLVEISPEVAEVARDHFAPFNHDALRNPRCRTHIEDAKTFPCSYTPLTPPTTLRVGTFAVAVPC